MKHLEAVKKHSAVAVSQKKYLVLIFHVGEILRVIVYFGSDTSVFVVVFVL